jgi:hypothetical protein
VEVQLPETPEGAYAVSVSDEALLVEANSEFNGFGVFAYLPGADSYVVLPLEGDAFPWVDIDGSLAVWREGTTDQETYEYVDTYIAAYQLPNGPKVEVARGALTMSYPQVAGGRVSWTEAEPSDFNPDEYWNHHIYVLDVNAKGEPVGEPAEVVSSAPAYMLGDSMWFYSLSGTHLAWENATAHRMFDAGTYVTELESEAEPQKVGNEGWRPSIGGNTVVFWEDSLRAFDLATGQTREIDPMGDFATAGPTYVAYYRTDHTGEVWTWDIVAKGYSGSYEQVLAETSLDPYFSAAIATSAKRVAFILDDVVRLFEWQEPVQD